MIWLEQDRSWGWLAGSVLCHLTAYSYLMSQWVRKYIPATGQKECNITEIVLLSGPAIHQSNNNPIKSQMEAAIQWYTECCDLLQIQLGLNAHFLIPLVSQPWICSPRVNVYKILTLEHLLYTGVPLLKSYKPALPCSHSFRSNTLQSTKASEHKT